MYEAFYTDVKGVTSNHLVDAISSTVPLAQTMETSIALGREWAKTRCRMAQKQEVENILSPDEIQIGRKVVI
jgi:hypothetical protein